MRPAFVRLRRLASKLRLERDWYLIPIAMAMGLLMGGVASAFILPLRLVEEWVDGHADPESLHWLVPTVPVVGALLAGVVMQVLRNPVRGPGVVAVLYSIHRRKSRLELRLAPRKWLASTLTIGSGGSAGAEGPIVTIGAVIGSNIARALRMSPQSTATLLGCGAAGGIAAVFNAPIAGIFFVMEILLRDFSLKTFTPIVLASVVASAYAQGILGTDPIFPTVSDYFREVEVFSVAQIPNFLLLGLICGAVGACFIRGLVLSEDLFIRLRTPTIVKPAIGAAMLGLLGLLYLQVFRNEHIPAFYGNGYGEIAKWLKPASYGAAFELSTMMPLVLLLCSIAILKALATCLTIGSGGAGGLFAPSLLVGAAAGGAFGTIVNAFNWFPAADPAVYALVGMGAMVAATTHAPLTGILIVYEITRSYETIMPLMIAAVISTIIGRIIYPESVYTAKLARLGVRLGGMSDLTILRRLSVQDVRLADAAVVRTDDSAQRLLDLAEQRQVSDFVVLDANDDYRGLVTNADLNAALVYREAIPLLQVSELVRTDLPTVTPDETLDVVLDKFSLHDVHSLAVIDDGQGHVRGLITRERLMQRYQRALSSA